MLLAYLAALAAAELPVSLDVVAPAVSPQLCEDSRVRETVASLIGAWSENYPFARVIIGSDGRFGFVGRGTPAVIGSGFVVCESYFILSKSGRDGRPYRVNIDRFYFRITADPGGFHVTLEDLPDTLEGTNLTSRDLISRFKINDRPYADILAENQQRIRERQQ